MGSGAVLRIIALVTQVDAGSRGLHGVSLDGTVDLDGADGGAGFPFFSVADGAADVDLDVGARLLGTKGLTKRGVGTMRLRSQNAAETPLFLKEGRLLVDGTIGAVFLDGGELGGHGTVGRVVTQSSGAISPGASPGVLHTGDLVTNSATTYRFELNGLAAGSQYDQLAVNGTVDLGGAALDLRLGFVPPPNASFTLIANDGTDPVTGTFAGLPEGAAITLGGAPFVITYKGGDGNDVVVRARSLVEVPTLSSLSLLLLGAILAGAALRWIGLRRDRC